MGVSCRRRLVGAHAELRCNRSTNLLVYSRGVRVFPLSILIVTLARAASAQSPAPYAVVFDQYMTPLAGAEDLVTTQHLLATLEDRWIPLKLGTESTRLSVARGALYRAGKFIAIDVPQEHMLMVVAHEVFGHGARFRELGDGRIGYGFDAPIPYGSGDAYTSFSGQFPVSPLAHMSVSASGIEAQHSLADAITDRAVARGRIHYREAWLYFESRLTGMTYILTASENSREGHDVADFLELFEDACKAPCSPLTRRYVQDRALLALADPLLFYALYGVAGSYIGDGSPTGPMPLIPVGRGVRMLPSLGYALAPYGAEWTVRTSWSMPRADRRRLTHLVLRVGNTGASTTWGLTARVADVWRIKGLQIDTAVNVWRQPDVFGDETSAPLGTGAGATGTVLVPLPGFLRSRWSDALHVTAGYKARGYIPGEQLSRGALLRAGVTLR